jgi:hypothetical protein
VVVRVRAARGLKSFFSFVRAYGVSCRARAERAALPGFVCLDSPHGCHLLSGPAPVRFPRLPDACAREFGRSFSGRQYNHASGRRESGCDAVLDPGPARARRCAAMAIIPPAAWDPSGSERGCFAE